MSGHFLDSDDVLSCRNGGNRRFDWLRGWFLARVPCCAQSGLVDEFTVGEGRTSRMCLTMGAGRIVEVLSGSSDEVNYITRSLYRIRHVFMRVDILEARYLPGLKSGQYCICVYVWIRKL